MWLDENDYPVKPDGMQHPCTSRCTFQNGVPISTNVRCRTNWQKPNVTHHSRQRTAPQMRNPMLQHLPYPPRGKVTIFLEQEVLGLTRHHARARGKKKVHGGSWSGHHGFRGLKWEQDNLELPWKMNLVNIESGVVGRRPDPPQQ